ncbi:hypothetical protein [Ramlibacter humi]|uniref:Polysaccharide deacetylase n=1 Tax=Ramlibacter humi TaxID=2530451 RepID=A0A4Z0BXZ7_9BURK|nr:hypothetical protein [Ramlibacter humi]TFZ03831.1 hypothetical protein EZ216_09270 [Ramlibacter humi]
MRDFTLEQYAVLVDFLRGQVGPLCSVLQWNRNRPECGVLVRHDVDRKPANALAMARLEAARGMFTTYYFRVVGSAWDEDVIRKVAALGHEVGYHYEDLTLARGDFGRAHELFSGHLARLRRLAPVLTVTMHGSPLSPHNNIDMWNQGHRADYGLEADAFLDVDYAGMPYFTDTGRSWGGGAANLRDKPASAGAPPQIRTSAELMAYVTGARPVRLALSAHPERWANDPIDWCAQLAKDTGINAVKRVLRAVR